ncbi:hypothetical protein QJQ45_009046 [Haematococcus lacustris]|nr:hypothetical protein QJQ45_009046 [Haematococcus lacustris]
MRPQLQTPKHASPQRIAINVKGAARACATRLASSFLGLQPTANQVAPASAAVKDPSSAGYEGRGRGDSSALREPGSTGPRLPGAKRACALHCAYVGTTFRGLQVIRDAPVEDSIEAVLELALLQGMHLSVSFGLPAARPACCGVGVQAGLIAPSNYGDLFKLKWSRSSRTDKGVHSLATVIGVKLVVQDADVVMEADKEGLGLATRINQHLPSSVLAVQKVNKAFSARRSCITRTYEYYLPAWLLGLHGDGRHEDSLRMGLVRQVLASFCGTHPFHNFTVRVKDYELSNAQLASKAKSESLLCQGNREARQASKPPPPSEPLPLPGLPIAATATPFSGHHQHNTSSLTPSSSSSSSSFTTLPAAAPGEHGQDQGQAAGSPWTWLLSLLQGLWPWRAAAASSSQALLLPAAAAAAVAATAAATAAALNWVPAVLAGKLAAVLAMVAAAVLLLRLAAPSSGPRASPQSSSRHPSHGAAGALVTSAPRSLSCSTTPSSSPLTTGPDPLAASITPHASSLAGHRAGAATQGQAQGSSQGQAQGSSQGQDGIQGASQPTLRRPRPPAPVAEAFSAGAEGREEREWEGSEDGEGGSEGDEESEGAVEGGESRGPQGLGFTRRWRHVCEWYGGQGGEGRRLGARLYRTITSFTAEEPRYLNPGGLLCVKLQVTGSSFMLNQIRHMVGAVVAVSRGCCSADLVRAALASPAKVTFPKAPPHTLLLGANTFLPFRPAGTEAEAPVSRFTGKALELREQGRSNQTQFRKEVLNPALEQLLQHPDWALYDQLHDKAYWDVQAADKVAVQLTTLVTEAVLSAWLRVWATCASATTPGTALGLDGLFGRSALLRVPEGTWRSEGRLKKDMADVSMVRHGRAKQLVVFFGAASIGTRGGTRVAPRSKRTKAEQAAERTQPTKAEQAVELSKGKAAKAKPAPQPGRWLDRDCNAALNMQRIGESRWRPLELCWWLDQVKLPAKGKEYPGLGYKQRQDKPHKAQQQQAVVAQ